MNIVLRDYQRDAVKAALDSLKAGRKPVVSLPTAAGKSLVAAAICAELPGRALVLSHRKELLEQDMAALNRYAPAVSTGLYSAGLGRRDTHQRVIFGGVASVYRRLDELQQAGKFHTIIIDESHLISPSNSDGIMYNTILKSLPDSGLVGLTATPYRLDAGLLHEGEGAWFNDLCIHIPPSTLVQRGFLSPLVGVGGRHQLDTDGVHVRQGDYVASELSQVACDGDRVARTVDEMLRQADGRRSGIVFAIDVEHAGMVFSELAQRHESVALVTGKTPADERADVLALYKAGDIRWLVNCQVLTTGFDAPATDCITLLRPTLSKGLYVQMMGRGMRLAEGKENCLILDFSGNILRHGNLDMLQEVRHEKTEKEERQERDSAQAARERQYNHAIRAFSGDPMTGTTELQELPVLKMQYRLADAKKISGKRNVVVDYCCPGLTVRQWLCVEYTGGARWHAEQFYRRRGMDAPHDAASALSAARKAPAPEAISIYYDEQGGQSWPKVAIEHFADLEIDEEHSDAA